MHWKPTFAKCSIVFYCLWRAAGCCWSHRRRFVPAAHNPRGSAQGRRAYRQKLAELREHCELVPYLGREMPSDYTEPHRRPPGFDLKLRTFFSLKDARPAFP